MIPLKFGIALIINLFLLNLAIADPSHECLFDMSSDHDSLVEAIQDRNSNGHICLSIEGRYFNPAIVDERLLQLIDGSMIKCRHIPNNLISSWKEEYELHMSIGTQQMGAGDASTLLVQDCEILYGQ